VQRCIDHALAVVDHPLGDLSCDGAMLARERQPLFEGFRPPVDRREFVFGQSLPGVLVVPYGQSLPAPAHALLGDRPTPPLAARLSTPRCPRADPFEFGFASRDPLLLNAGQMLVRSVFGRRLCIGVVRIDFALHFPLDVRPELAPFVLRELPFVRRVFVRLCIDRNFITDSVATVHWYHLI